MTLKYVGAMPMVSSRGVGFDPTKPDRFTFLNAAIELLEAFDFTPTETTQHLHNINPREYTGEEIVELLQSYCSDLNAVFTKREQKANALIQDHISRVHENCTINEDERCAWLNNIELMKDYYLQYVTNESAYKCSLEVLGREIHDARIEEVTFPMFRNYGLVLHDLIYVLEHAKSPIDAELSAVQKENGFFGKLSLKHR